MSLASESHFIGIVNIDHLLSLESQVRYNLPEARKWVSEARETLFQSLCREFVSNLFRCDLKRLSDENYQLVERSTQIVLKAVELHMLSKQGAGECQPLVDIHHRLRDAVEGLDAGLPLDPAQRPSHEDLMAEFANDIERLGLLQSLGPQTDFERR